MHALGAPTYQEQAHALGCEMHSCVHGKEN